MCPVGIEIIPDRVYTFKTLLLQLDHNHRRSTVVLISIGSSSNENQNTTYSDNSDIGGSLFITVKLISNVSVFWWCLEMKLFCH